MMRVDTQRHSHLIIILLSALVGMGLMAMLIYFPHETAARAQAPAGNLSGGDWRTAFSNVAEYVLPRVVSIQGKRKVAPRVDIEDFFRNFPFPFGPEERGQQAPKPKPREASFLGSGWIYSADGYIVTNAHVVMESTNLRVQLHDVDGTAPIPATVVGYDARSDLAVIKVEAGRELPYLTLGSSKDARVGQWVLAVGSPFSPELQQTVTQGIISAKGRVVPADELGAVGYSIPDVIQTDASFNPGQSGGPLVDLNGQVLGINESIFSPTGALGGNIGIGFAISSDMAGKVIPQLIAKKKIVRGWLGIGIRDLSENMREFYKAPSGGALITQISPEGPASKSDLQLEDVVVKVNDTPVHSASDLQRVVSELPPGETATFEVIRSGQSKSISIKIGEMPDDGGLSPSKPSPEEQVEAADPLGLRVQTLTGNMPQARALGVSKGVLVAAVNEGGPSAGILLKDDVITAVNRTTVTSAAEYRAALNAAKEAGAKFVVVRITRKADDRVLSTVVDITPDW